MTTTTTEPLSPVEDRTDSPLIKPRNIVTADDLRIAGSILGTVVILSTIMNLYTFYVVFRNWRRFIQFPFSQSNIMCMFLSLADLVFAVLVGLPAALHLQYAVYYSEQQPLTMVNYASSIEWFLLEYIFLLRLIIIAVICIDRCVHIIRPLTYKFFVTHRVTILVCGVVLASPFIMRSLPNIIYLNIGGDLTADIICSSFFKVDINTITDRAQFHEIHHDHMVNSLRYTVPLTCRIAMSRAIDRSQSSGGDSTIGQIALSELIIMISGLIISWLVIVVSNIIIMVVIFKRTKDRGILTHDANAQKKKVQQSIQKNLIATLVMSLAFLATNSPYIIIYLTEYMACAVQGVRIFLQNDEKVRLFMVMTLFLSLLINPWLYLFRMETIRRFFPCFKGSVETGSCAKRNTTTRSHQELTLRSAGGRCRRDTSLSQDLAHHPTYFRSNTRLVNLSCSSLTGISSTTTTPHPSPLPPSGRSSHSHNGVMEMCEELPSHGSYSHDPLDHEGMGDGEDGCHGNEDSVVLEESEIVCIVPGDETECCEDQYVVSNPIVNDTHI